MWAGVSTCIGPLLGREEGRPLQAGVPSCPLVHPLEGEAKTEESRVRFGERLSTDDRAEALEPACA